MSLLRKGSMLPIFLLLFGVFALIIPCMIMFPTETIIVITPVLAWIGGCLIISDNQQYGFLVLSIVAIVLASYAWSFLLNGV